jgi:DNA-binding protein HU-beta
MATNDLFKRLIDAGLSFTQMTQARAEDIVRELQQSGQVRMDEAQATVQELVSRGRENTEAVVGIVQREVAKQMAFVSANVRDLEGRVEDLAKRVGIGATAAPSGVTRTTAKKAPARKSSAKKSTARKSTAKKSTARKSAAKKSTARKSTAKKSTARKSAAKRAPAKQAAAATSAAGTPATG